MSERKYFPINEGAARTAHNMMSMRDYSEGSTTRGYQSEVNKAYGLGLRTVIFCLSRRASSLIWQSSHAKTHKERWWIDGNKRDKNTL